MAYNRLYNGNRTPAPTTETPDIRNNTTAMMEMYKGLTGQGYTGTPATPAAPKTPAAPTAPKPPAAPTGGNQGQKSKKTTTSKNLTKKTKATTAPASSKEVASTVSKGSVTKTSTNSALPKYTVASYADQIRKSYENQLASKIADIKSNYNNGIADLDRSLAESRKSTDANLNTTYVEAARQQRNFGELQNAYGLSSGAMSQAAVAHDNALSSNMASIRNQFAETEAENMRQRNRLKYEQELGIGKAKSDIDTARDAALLAEKKRYDDAVLAEQKRYDASVLEKEQRDKAVRDAEALRAEAATKEADARRLEAAKLAAQGGKYRLLADYYGVPVAYIKSAYEKAQNK